MVHRPLGRTGLHISPIGFGAFKIGRNQGTKYAQSYELPSRDEAATLINGIVDLGLNYIDTAPAYGFSEERIGVALTNRHDNVVISTKVGERFEGDRSFFDFSEDGVRASIVLSRQRLGKDRLDLVFVHSDGNDLHVINDTAVVKTLLDLREQGVIGAIGFSGKTVQGAAAALRWADAIMVEYHIDDRSHESVIVEAAKRKVGVIVKKGLASGRLNASDAIRFVLSNHNVTAMVIGGLNLEHMSQNIQTAQLVQPAE